MDWTQLGSGFLLGISVAMPPGPTTAELLRRGLRHGGPAAWRVGLGAVTADAAWFLLGLYGLAPVLLHSPLLQGLLWPLLLGLLGYLAFVGFRSALDDPADTDGSRLGRAEGSGFLHGLGLTLFNPLTIAFWLSVAGGLRATGGTAADLLGGQVLGGLSWFTLLSVLAALARRVLTGRFFRLLSLASGVILTGYFFTFLAIAWRGGR